MTVRVAIDFNCAASWLAVDPTRTLEAKLGTTFEWLPFPAVASTQPRVEVPRSERSARHFMMRFQYLADDIRRYARSRGLAIDDIYKSFDTTAASLGLIWIGKQSPERAGEYVSRVFDRIWRSDAQPDEGFVEAALGSAARGFRDFASGAGRAELDTIRERLAEEGLWNVPGYLAGGEIFIGRQHLPMVEWLATAGDEAALAIRRSV